jgi:hypothetical protein
MNRLSASIPKSPDNELLYNFREQAKGALVYIAAALKPLWELSQKPPFMKLDR